MCHAKRDIETHTSILIRLAAIPRSLPERVLFHMVHQAVP